jgi:DNA end-binding protein Ku
LWKGSLAFGLVNIPIELHTAVRNHRPRFHLLHATDMSRVKFSRICAREGRPVDWQDLVKGYEYAKGRFVVLSKADFAAAAVEKTRRVDILDFVEAADIDDRYFETPYYAVPGRGGDHAYALLREAMRESKRVGIAKFILRDALHLAAVEVIGQTLVLTTMRFADELIDPRQFSLPARTRTHGNELGMAKMLVNSLAAPWDPSKYTDDYRDNLMRIVEGKVKGKKVHLEAQEEPRQAEVVDLMERLRRSLEGRTRKPGRARSHASITATRKGTKRKPRRAA